MEYLINLGYLGMFIAAFMAGSVLPGNSEIVFSGLMALQLDKWWLLFWATFGNVMGGITCYYLGYLGNKEKILKLTKVKPERFDKIQKFLDGKGAWMAFFVFLPFIGDIIIVIFGLMRSNIYIVSIAMLIGKFLKYFVWMWLTLGVIEIVS